MTAPILLPEWAYVPGQTERHEEGFFDPIRVTASPGMTPDALARSDAFLTGLKYLETGFFWEAHEVLEPVWMALPDDSDERRFVQALIQLANAELKNRMNRAKACLRLCGIVRKLLNDVQQETVLGCEKSATIRQVTRLEAQWRDAL